MSQRRSFCIISWWCGLEGSKMVSLKQCQDHFGRVCDVFPSKMKLICIVAPLILPLHRASHFSSTALFCQALKWQTWRTFAHREVSWTVLLSDQQARCQEGNTILFPVLRLKWGYFTRSLEKVWLPFLCFSYYLCLDNCCLMLFTC